MAGFVIYLIVALAVSVSANTLRNVKDAGVPGGDIGAAECKKANITVWHLPYPGDCSKFIKCHILGNKSTIYTCDTPLHFNPSIQTCDWPENAGCDGTGGGSGSSSTTARPDPTTNSPSPNSTTDATTTSPTGGIDVCAAATPDRWHLPHPDDCSKFIKCDLVSGSWHVFDCPPPLHFNPAIQVCDWPENAGCDLGTTTTTRPTPPTTCSSSTTPPSECGTTTAAPDCSTPKPTECPTPDPGPGPGPAPSTSGPPAPSTSGPPIGVCPSPFGPGDVCRAATEHHWHLPHPTDVTKFYKCEINSCRAFLFDCPDGLVFNPPIQVCDWP